MAIIVKLTPKDVKNLLQIGFDKSKSASNTQNNLKELNSNFFSSLEMYMWYLWKSDLTAFGSFKNTTTLQSVL